MTRCAISPAGIVEERHASLFLLAELRLTIQVLVELAAVGMETLILQLKPFQGEEDLRVCLVCVIKNLCPKSAAELARVRRAFYLRNHLRGIPIGHFIRSQKREGRLFA